LFAKELKHIQLKGSRAMYEPERSLNDLAELARHGDEDARTELQQRLAPYVPTIVRRALRHGTPNLSVTRKIRRTAARLRWERQAASAKGSVGLVHRVTGCILGIVRSASRNRAVPELCLRDTVRC
jgi:hypothetical protein